MTNDGFKVRSSSFITTACLQPGKLKQFEQAAITYRKNADMLTLREEARINHFLNHLSDLISGKEMNSAVGLKIYRSDKEIRYEVKSFSGNVSVSKTSQYTRPIEIN